MRRWSLTPGDLKRRLDEYQQKRWEDEPSVFFAKRGLDHSTVSRFGLGYTGTLGKTRQQDLRRCLVLPYEDGLGRLRQLRYRPLYSGAPHKYLSVGADAPNLFAVRAADNAACYICEGEIDAMTAWQCGFRAVGIPGVGTWKSEWKYLFRPPHVGRVVLALDPDKSGQELARALYSDLRSIIDVDVVRLPKGKDLNECLVEFGEDMVKEALNV